MKALTLIRPWSWAITDGGKRVENRSWQPSWRGLRPGEPLLIHAGQRYDADGAVWMRNELGLDVPSEAACQKGLVALARFERCVADPLALPDEQVRWFFGPYGWLLGDVIPWCPSRALERRGFGMSTAGCWATSSRVTRRRARPSPRST